MRLLRRQASSMNLTSDPESPALSPPEVATPCRAAATTYPFVAESLLLATAAPALVGEALRPHAGSAPGR
jgi:hypothetical protein